MRCGSVRQRASPRCRSTRTDPRRNARAAHTGANGPTGEPVSARLPLREPADGLGVGVALAVGVVPVSVIVPELWSLTVKLVVAECVPVVCGANLYVNAQDALGVSVTPLQFWAEVKLGSPAAPPARVNVCGVVDLFVTTTS